MEAEAFFDGVKVALMGLILFQLWKIVGLLETIAAQI
tara:strand:- start:606 stop:716 length:111 start_codon:yes stop_codon:yes gene_type:complete